jgi:polysaccharide biosynthesis/export protein
MKMLSLKNICGAFLIIILSGCEIITNGMHFPVTSNAQSMLSKDTAVEIIKIDSENIHKMSQFITKPDKKNAPYLKPNPEYIYKIGSGDVLRVMIWDTPGGTSTAAAATLNPTVVVSEAGSIFYPFAGKVRVSGMTVDEVRRILTKKLSKYIKSPQVDVAVVEFNAHHATIVGAVASPGRFGLTNIPLKLLDALNVAAPTERADLSQVILRRSGREYIVDIAKYISNGLDSQNPITYPKDVILVPKIQIDTVYTFGEIKVGELEISGNEKSLTSILARRGGIDKIRADARGVFVFRKTTDDAPLKVYQFSLAEPSILVLAQAFDMRAGDVLFVTQEPISRWNDAVSKVLSPVVTTIRAQALLEAVEG